MREGLNNNDDDALVNISTGGENIRAVIVVVVVRVESEYTVPFFASIRLKRSS